MNKALWHFLGFSILIALWYIIADVFLMQQKVLLDPHSSLIRIFELATDTSSAGRFWGAIGSTLFWTVLSFAFSFIVALVCAGLAHKKYNLRYIISPFINVFRASPVVAIIIFLLLLFPWYIIPFIVAVLMTFPMLFQNLLASFDSVLQNEIDAADSIGLSGFAKIVNVYLPNTLGAMVANMRSGFGMNLKVIIAAQVLGIPTLSIGSLIINAKQSFEYQDAFCYLVVIIIIAYIFDLLLSKIKA